MITPERRATTNQRADARIEFTFVRSTEAAAIAAGRLVGRGDKNGVDASAVDAMRAVLGEADIAGVVVIGEGEKDEAPMLYIDEEVGTGDGPALDIAVDPIDGTTLAAKGGAGAISVVAAAERGTLFHTHVPYMDKIVVGPTGRGAISIDASPEENVRRLAARLERPVSEITVAFLDRPRNEPILRAIQKVGARARIFSDGDVAMSIIALLEERSKIDMLMGIGGAPEGVLTACAVRCLGGDMQARLWPRDERDREQAQREGIDPDAVLTLDELCRGKHVIVAATGVTDGELLAGVRYRHGSAYVQSLILSSITRSQRTLEAKHRLGPDGLLPTPLVM